MKYFLDTEFIEGSQRREFLGFKIGDSKPTIDLISIGIVAEDGREYYAISKDFNLKDAWNRFDIKTKGPYDSSGKGIEFKEYWLRYNVLKAIYRELLIKSEQEWFAYAKEAEYNLFLENVKNGNYDISFTYKNFKSLIKKYGKTNKEIASGIRNFIYLEDRDFGGQFVLGNFIPNKYPNPEFWADYCSYDWVVFCWLFGKMIDLPKGFPMYCNDIQQLLRQKANVFINKVSYDSGNHTILDLKEGINEIKNSTDYPKQDDSKKHHALEDARYDRDLYNFLSKL